MTPEQKKVRMEEMEQIDRKIAELTEALWERRTMPIIEVDTGLVLDPDAPGYDPTLLRKDLYSNRVASDPPLPQ